MRFGPVILPHYYWPEAGRLWRQAEDLGFDHAWTYDHLSWRGLAGERWHATVPTLTAAAMVTAEEAEDIGKVPMFLAMDNLEGFEEGDELELVILGHYVSYRCVGNCAKFDWIPLA